MKLTQKKCSIKLPSTKSANALCRLNLVSQRCPFLSCFLSPSIPAIPCSKGNRQQNSPLMTNAPKLALILRIRLDPQAGREHELPDRGAEAGEEGVEGL